MLNLINQIAGSPSAARRLRRDALREADLAGYEVSAEEMGAFLGVDVAVRQEVGGALRVHVARFNRGKWYEVG